MCCYRVSSGLVRVHSILAVFTDLKPILARFLLGFTRLHDVNFIGCRPLIHWRLGAGAGHQFQLRNERIVNFRNTTPAASSVRGNKNKNETRRTHKIKIIRIYLWDDGARPATEIHRVNQPGWEKVKWVTTVRRAQLCFSFFLVFLFLLPLERRIKKTTCWQLSSICLCRLNLKKFGLVHSHVMSSAEIIKRLLNLIRCFVLI